MRIFISMPDETGSHKTTRLSIINCSDTSQLIKIIGKQLNINKNAFIFLVKNEIVNLRILQNWPLSIYGIKNGSWILLKQNLLFSKKQLSSDSTSSLQKIQENQQDNSQQIQNSLDLSLQNISFFSSKHQQDYHQYFQKQLVKMLDKIRSNHLDQIALLLKSQPDIQDEELRQQIITKKNYYILNQIGECGRNALHWAIHNQNIEMVSFLLIKSADPTTLTIDQYTPLQLAVVHRNIEIVKLLLNQPKCDPNRVTSHGTALHLAAYHHSIELVKLLIDHGANPDQVDKDGKKPVQLSQIKQIKEVFDDHQKKLKLRFIKPNITKGNVLKISSMTFRSKQRTLMINPFKDQFILMKQNNSVDYKIKISCITNSQKINEKAWLMDSKLNYIKISYSLQGNSNQDKIMIALKHPQILGKWLAAIELARQYANNSKYVTKILPEMQLIELLDDSKNQVKVHKRQIKDKKPQSPTKLKYSIFNMTVSNQTQPTTQTQKFISPKAKNRQYQDVHEVHLEEQDQKSVQKSFSSSIQGDDLRESQILLGSILTEKNFQQCFSPQASRNTVSAMTFNNISKLNSTFQTQKEDFLTQPAKMSNFRKKSSDIKISTFHVSSQSPQKKLSFSDFQFKTLLGSGAFGQVYLAKHKKTQKMFAMKVLNKKKLIVKKQLKYAVSQTNILKRVQNPFIICLHYSFQTPSNLYLALDYCPYGDLSEILCQKQRFTQATARFIISQAILAIQYLHKLKIIYRDLKPENILLGKDGFIKLIDFGLSKQNNNFATSFCGSPAYLSPEMLDKKGHSFPTDIYGLGCVLYEMVVGQPPYYDQSMDQMFDNIKNARLKFPGYLTKQIKGLLNRMLERDASKRIGATDMKEIKSHEFFKGFSWQKMQKKQLSVPKQIFPESVESDYFKLQNKIHQQALKYVDQDYTQASMLNRIKGFSFSRQNIIF